MTSLNENISKEDAKRLQRMKSADPEQAKRLQSELESSKEASRRKDSGETRTSQSGQKTRTKPSARDEFEKTVKQRTPQGVSAASDTGDPKLRTTSANTSARAARTTPQGRVKLGEFPGAGQVKVIKPTQSTPAPKPAPKPEFKVTPTPTVQKPEPIKQSEVSKRAARFRQSFGTPTGADPFTGRATYRPVDSMTQLPKPSRSGTTPTPEKYSKVKVGDLDAKRILRTMGPKGTPTTRGVENFALNRETQGRFSPSTRRGRTLSPSDSKAAVERVKATMADPAKVADIKGRISQEVGGRRAQVTSPNPVASRSTSAATASTTAVRRVRVKVDPPQTLKKAALPPASSTPTKPQPSAPAKPKPSSAPVKTMTRVRQSLNLTPAPEPSFRVSGTTKQTKAPQLPPVGNTTAPKPTAVKPVTTNTPGQSLEFGKTRSGSFTYKPGTTTSTTPPRTAPPTPVADPTRRRASGNAGPSSRIDAGPKPPATPQNPVTPQQMRKATQVPNLGQGSTSPRQGTSVSYKPPKPTATKPPTPRASSGVGSGAFYGVFNAMSAAEREKARGQTAERQRDAAIASGTGSTLGSAAATRALSSVLGPKAKAVTNLVAPIAGSMVGDKVADYVMGASDSDKQWMARQNRLNQTGVPGQSATSRRGNRAVVRDAGGKERVGYLAYKDGKPVYKTANDPSSLAYTSSNPLERIGRRTADAGVPYVSDWLKGHYGRKDDATRRANVAAQKARAGN